MQTNELGEVGIRRYRQMPKDVIIGGKVYRFRVQANISFSWVSPEHIDRILQFRHTCCGGSSKKEFHLASELDIRRWQNKGGS